ncbi:heme ABC transporter ATP-binding protein [Fictibacillus sp. Mic-4]|uniref:heme ABC transporter ATP-binding protein n=1 Tax=Fictibacillus sp. Mic-4 TaxID=3132826 RepID=UPI003CEDCE28
MMLHVENVTAGYNGKDIVHQVTFSVPKGEFFGIIGPNGSGKTTLLRSISGELSVKSGKLNVMDRPIQSFSSKERARRIAVLPQHNETAFDYSVKETVALGRYPYYEGFFKQSSKRDDEVVEMVMGETGIAQFAEQSLGNLSGGERQRVFLAKALAQEPELLLLDEPTNHLDLSYQMKLLELIKERTIDKKLTVVAILHDLNLASLYCDRLMLLNEGKCEALGTPIEVMNDANLKKVYGIPLHRHTHPRVAKPLIALMPEEKAEEQSLEHVTIETTENMMVVRSPFPFKTLSSALVGGGFNWATTFVNRHVDKNYNCSEAKQEYIRYLCANRLNITGTVGMMTAALLEDAGMKSIQNEECRVLAIVTAGTSNSVDISRSWEYAAGTMKVGTINIWVFVEGELTEEAFTQAMMTATEAKTKALALEQIIDRNSGTVATGTSTDSMCIAATQTGKKIEYAGTITPVGKWIGKAVFDALIEAIQNYKRRREEL